MVEGTPSHQQLLSVQFATAVDQMRAESARATEKTVARITAAAMEAAAAAAVPAKLAVPVPVAEAMAVGATAMTAAIYSAPCICDARSRTRRSRWRRFGIGMVDDQMKAAFLLVQPDLSASPAPPAICAAPLDDLAPAPEQAELISVSGADSERSSSPEWKICNEEPLSH